MTSEAWYAWLPEGIDYAEDIDLITLKEAYNRTQFFYDSLVPYRLVRVSAYPVGQAVDGEMLYKPVEVLYYLKGV